PRDLAPREVQCADAPQGQGTGAARRLACASRRIGRPSPRFHDTGAIIPMTRLRSARWLDVDDLRSFGHRSRLMQMGYALEDWNGRPVIAIINTWSDINPCHAHFRHRVED